LESFVSPKQKNLILEDLGKFDIDPKRYDGYLLGSALSGNGHGTHFYILPASEILESDLAQDENSNNASRMQKTLLGFTNTMSPNHPTPPIKTVFRDHTTPEAWDDVIETLEFFVPDEFSNADHYIKGQFNEYGQFQGNVTVFGTEYKDHIVSWKGSSAKITDCGPFNIEIGYVQGRENESTLPSEDYFKITSKLNRYGGLYIYRDNVRVLPYGENDVDWINMERRRSQNAAHYFFSYRRIFGLINIGQEYNSNLVEKAGREGFRENKAYRQFRDIIQSFFVQLAAEFFRESGAYSEAFTKRKNDAKTAQFAERRARELKIAHAAFEKNSARSSKVLSKNILNNMSKV